MQVKKLMMMAGAAALAAGCSSMIGPRPAGVPTWKEAHMEEKHLSDLGVWAVTDDAKIVQLKEDCKDDAANWKAVCERIWQPTDCPRARPFIRESELGALKGPNHISTVCHKAAWQLSKVMITCDGGAFVQYDPHLRKIEVFGIVEGRPCGITQLKNTVFVLACPDKDRLTFVDTIAHPFRSENQPKSHFAFKGASGCAWDQVRGVLWAIGDEGLVALRYNLLTDRSVEPLYGYDWSAYGTRARDFQLWNDGKIRFTTEKGVVVFDPDAETFALLPGTAGVTSFAPSSKGDLRFSEADGAVIRGDAKKVPTSTLKIKAATLMPTWFRDFDTAG